MVLVAKCSCLVFGVCQNESNKSTKIQRRKSVSESIHFSKIYILVSVFSLHLECRCVVCAWLRLNQKNERITIALSSYEQNVIISLKCVKLSILLYE